SRARPRLRIEVSPKLWLGAFLATASIFLVQTDAERISAGRWPLLAPWLHTSALPVFAVLAVVVAVVYGVVTQWLGDYETYARETAADALCACSGVMVLQTFNEHHDITPRSVFGHSGESRAPPA